MWKICDGAKLHNASVFLYCPANFTMVPLLLINICIFDIQYYLELVVKQWHSVTVNSAKWGCLQNQVVNLRKIISASK